MRRACPSMRFTELPTQLTLTVAPIVCRKCHRLDTALHRWRLPLHSFGECGARPAGGVQFKVSVYVQTPSETLRGSPSFPSEATC